MLPPELLSDAAGTSANVPRAAPQSATCCGALRSLFGGGAGGNDATVHSMSSTQAPPPTPTAKSGAGRASADAPLGGAEPLSAKACEELRDAFLRGSNRSNVNDVYALGDTIGTGGFAVVLRAVHRKTRQEFAVKVMQLSTTRPFENEVAAPASAAPAAGSPSLRFGGSRVAAEEDVMKEVQLLKSIDHPALLRLHEYFIASGRSGRRCFVVTELLRGGELLEALLERGAYSERDARTIFATILGGVAYLHERHITHRDLKLENLLLGDKNDLSSVRIADFGLAHAPLHPEDTSLMSLVCGTPMYVAPEIVTGKRYGSSVDLWSCGVVLFILLSGVVPFDEDPIDEQAIYRRIARGAYSLKAPEWQAVSAEAKTLVTSLLTVNPAQRLTAAAALTHPWLSVAVTLPAEAVLPGAATGLLAFAARLRAPAVRVYSPGAYLIRQGDPATEMLILRSGTCNVLVQDDKAAAPRILATRKPPEFVGEMGILMDRNGKIAVPGLSGHIDSYGATQVDSALHDLQDLHLRADEDDDDDLVIGRRTASVVAVTQVEAAVLRAREVRWALRHDESVRREIVTAIETRQRELRGAPPLRTASSQPALINSAQQEEPPATGPLATTL